MPYTFLEHTADIRMHVTGATLPELFKDALFGMMYILSPSFEKGKAVKRTVEISADDNTVLLIDFLSEALLLVYTHRETYDNAAIWLEYGKLKAELEGYKVDSFAEDIKAVTYHEADVKETRGVWESTVVFDI